MALTHIGFAEADPLLDWCELADALAEGHGFPKAEIGDTFLYRGQDTLLSRSAWIDGMGVAVKSATIFPENPEKSLPSINGALCLFSDADGQLEALIDFHLVTKWKTVGDSLLAAQRLARADSEAILIVGAGTVAETAMEAFGQGFPGARFTIWNRSTAKAAALAERHPNAMLAKDLPSAVAKADIIVTCTMATEPVVKGEWLQPGQHLNLIGAYRPDMREVDDRALMRSRIFADSFDTTIGHIGEIEDPLKRGVISRTDLLADFYDLSRFAREGEEITLFKNGGGAHLDLMTARYILMKWKRSGNAVGYSV